MPVSIADVAKQAGVSSGTVSHVLNGNTRAGIAPATQLRVRQAADALGYRPNRMARSLGRGCTDTLGLFISGLQNPFFVQLMECAERMALDAGYHVLLDAAPSGAGTERHKAKLRGWPMDGALMWAQPQETLSEFLGGQADNLPVVYMGGQPRLRENEGNAVYLDVYSGTRAAMAHLLARGYQRIAYLFPFTWVLTQEQEPRHKAYREVCAETGITPQMIQMQRHEQTRRAGFEAGLDVAAMSATERPEAILCFNDIVAQGVLAGLRRAGLQIPGDIAVVGFDGLNESQYLEVPLTTVLLPTEELCRKAFDLLLRRIKEGNDMPPEIVKIPTQLIVGGTT